MTSVLAPESRAVPSSFLLTTSLFDESEDSHWPPHSHDEHELIWSERGAVTATADGGSWAVLPGTGLWIPSGLVHETRITRGVVFRATLFAPETWTPVWRGATAVKVNSAVQRLLVHLARTGMPSEERLRAQQVCIDMLEPLDSRDSAVPIPQDRRIAALVERVLADPADDRSLEQWSLVLNMSPRTVTRAFSADVAMSFAQWRRLVRMRAARALLVEGRSVGAVGRCVGYSTTSAFVAAFRKVVGCTPGEFLVES